MRNSEEAIIDDDQLVAMARAALHAAHRRGWLTWLADPAILRARLVKRLLQPPPPPSPSSVRL